MTEPQSAIEAAKGSTDYQKLKQYIDAGIEALDATNTDPKVMAIAETARKHVSGVTPLSEDVDREGAHLTMQVVTALRAAEKSVRDGKANIHDPEISLEMITGWISDLERSGPTRVYRVCRSLKDILRSIKVIESATEEL